MFTTVLPPIDQYRNVGAATDVAQASPHQLVMLLLDGAIAAVLQARHAVATGDIETRHRTISKAMRIIDEGLKASIESHGDASLAENLAALYEHMVGRLFQANLRNADEPLGEVARLLGDLRSTWAEIAPRPAQLATAVRA